MRRATLLTSCAADRPSVLLHCKLTQTRSHPASPPPDARESTNGQPPAHLSHSVATGMLDPDRRQRIVTCTPLSLIFFPKSIPCYDTDSCRDSVILSNLPGTFLRQAQNRLCRATLKRPLRGWFLKGSD